MNADLWLVLVWPVVVFVVCTLLLRASDAATSSISRFFQRKLAPRRVRKERLREEAKVRDREAFRADQVELALANPTAENMSHLRTRDFRTVYLTLRTTNPEAAARIEAELPWAKEEIDE